MRVRRYNLLAHPVGIPSGSRPWAEYTFSLTIGFRICLREEPIKKKSFDSCPVERDRTSNGTVSRTGGIDKCKERQRSLKMCSESPGVAVGIGVWESAGMQLRRIGGPIWSMAAERRGAFYGWMHRKSMGRRRRVYWFNEDKNINKRLCHGTTANGHKTASRKTAKISNAKRRKKKVLVDCKEPTQQKSCWALETKQELTTLEENSRRNVSNTSSST
ncbi:unnamed protein product [Caenorhabditis brenneri]